MNCSVTKQLRIVPGTLDDYSRLAHYHYRGGPPGPLAGIFVLKPVSPASNLSPTEVVGVIAYSMPAAGLQLRNTATGNFLLGLDRATQLAVINKNIRCISRVIIDPRFRSLGLAALLVAETMPKMNVPIVEALAVMGMVNPFFERADMKPYQAPMPLRCVQLIEAFSAAGIEEDTLLDAELVQQKLDMLRCPAADLSAVRVADFIERRIHAFLQSYGRRRNMPPGIERTRFILSKLTERPIYYIWFNQNLAVSV